MYKIILAACTLIVITGCSFQNVKNEETPREETLKEETFGQDNLVTESDEIETDEGTQEEVVIEKQEEDTSAIIDNSDVETPNQETPIQPKPQEDSSGGGDPLTNSVAYDNMLFYEYGDITKLESANYLSLGDIVELRDNEVVYANVKLNEFKIIDSTDGKRRKALALFYTVTNVTDKEIETGAYPNAKNPTFVPEVFYGDKSLKLLRSGTPTLKFDGEDYVNNKHVQFSEEDAKMPACTQITTLKAGESLKCYAHYSFPGMGKYLVGQIAESEWKEWRTYSINVTQDDMNK